MQPHTDLYLVDGPPVQATHCHAPYIWRRSPCNTATRPLRMATQFKQHTVTSLTYGGHTQTRTMQTAPKSRLLAEMPFAHAPQFRSPVIRVLKMASQSRAYANTAFADGASVHATSKLFLFRWQRKTGHISAPRLQKAQKTQRPEDTTLEDGATNQQVFCRQRTSPGHRSTRPLQKAPHSMSQRHVLCRWLRSPSTTPTRPLQRAPQFMPQADTSLADGPAVQTAGRKVLKMVLHSRAHVDTFLTDGAAVQGTQCHVTFR
jgi:hypothetical protein